MFIINLHYKVAITEVEKYLLEHVQYLETQYASGYFLASGRKVPRTGGVILAQFSSEEEAWQIIRQDPFYIHQIADYQLTQFVPSKTAPSLAFLQES